MDGQREAQSEGAGGAAGAAAGPDTSAQLDPLFLAMSRFRRRHFDLAIDTW